MQITETKVQETADAKCNASTRAMQVKSNLFYNFVNKPKTVTLDGDAPSLRKLSHSVDFPLFHKEILIKVIVLVSGSLFVMRSMHPASQERKLRRSLLTRPQPHRAPHAGRLSPLHHRVADLPPLPPRLQRQPLPHGRHLRRGAPLPPLGGCEGDPSREHAGGLEGALLAGGVGGEFAPPPEQLDDDCGLVGSPPGVFPHDSLVLVLEEHHVVTRRVRLPDPLLAPRTLEQHFRLQLLSLHLGLRDLVGGGLGVGAAEGELGGVDVELAGGGGLLEGQLLGRGEGFPLLDDFDHDFGLPHGGELLPDFVEPLPRELPVQLAAQLAVLPLPKHFHSNQNMRTNQPLRISPPPPPPYPTPTRPPPPPHLIPPPPSDSLPPLPSCHALPFYTAVGHPQKGAEPTLPSACQSNAVEQLLLLEVKHAVRPAGSVESKI